LANRQAILINMNTDVADIEAGINIAQLLRSAPFEPLENRLLVAHGLRLSREQLITQSTHCLTMLEAQAVTTLFKRRQQGEPIAYILGSREFYGLAMYVTPDVLIPRADTELLVDLALSHATASARVADLGTGSGAIAVALARTRRDLHVTATDISGAALDVARHNAALHRVSPTFLQGDWYAALGDHRFDLIVANPPYIVAGDHHLVQGDLRFEPIDALTDHGDGLTALRLLASGAAAHLLPDGWLMLEHGYDQAEAVRALLAANGFEQVQSWRDLAGIERVSGGQLSIQK
jgi:release factor glutamine methyltransferase